MNQLNQFSYLLSGVFVLLVFASTVTWYLSRHAKNEQARATVENLRHRVNAWWVMVIVAAVSLQLGPKFTIGLFAIMSFFALREFLTLTPTRPGDHTAMAMCFMFVLPVQYLLIAYDWYGLFAIFIPVYVFLLLPSLSVIAEDTGNFLERVAKLQWGVIVTIYCISHVPALLSLTIPGYSGQNALLVFYLLTVVQISDVLQYVCGKLFGKNKLAAVVSPSKTTEGLVGGGLLAILVGTALYWITPFSPAQATAISSVIVVMGALGGLVMSAVKRSIGAKDWGDLISGHGGMMDRLDSVCFAAPVFFHIVRYTYM